MKSLPLRAHEAAAYAAGRLTQLRRVCKFDPKIVHASYPDGTFETARIFSRSDYSGRVKAPYGAPGDALALREGYIIGFPCVDGELQDCDEDGADLPKHVWYRAGGDGLRFMSNLGAEIAEWTDDSGYCCEIPWRSPVTMPVWAVRWRPVITAVRLERVQEMNEVDARACGIEFTDEGPLHWHTMIGDWCVNRATHKEAAQDLWNHLNSRTPWESNPWVWVIDVEGVKA